MRVFFAFGPEPDCALRIADWRDRHAACDGRAVPAANFHLTLAFVGELEERALEELCAAVDRRAPGWAATGLTLNRVGYWPRPGIYWLGPACWPAELDALAATLRQLAVTAGARRERKRFTPHITLYRNCRQPPPAPQRPPHIEFRCQTLCLYESRRGRHGVSYHPLCEWPPGVAPAHIAATPGDNNGDNDTR
ncbi:MAG: RNA 2',3'-cyclic phosphodiesterase [Halioglobus sp.]|nr:RNA 2',3'-cyclic phosphodiesterase [Halioglobus sp.]